MRWLDQKQHCLKFDIVSVEKSDSTLEIESESVICMDISSALNVASAV